MHWPLSQAGMTFACHMKISSKESLLGKFNMVRAGRGADKPVPLSQFIFTDRLPYLKQGGGGGGDGG